MKNKVFRLLILVLFVSMALFVSACKDNDSVKKLIGCKKNKGGSLLESTPIYEGGVTSENGSQGLIYQVFGDGYSVVGIGSCTDTDLIIPATYDNSPVTSINSGAFSNCSSLTSVVIPDSVTTIGLEAFKGCSSLTSVVIPDSVTEIGYFVFEDCTSLTSVIIPDSVTEIGGGVFNNCSSLTSVKIGNGVTNLSEGLFSGCSNLQSISLPFVGGSKSSSFSFGYIFGTSSYAGGTAIEQYDFNGSFVTYYIPSSLTQVTITDDKSLYRDFYNCSMITSVVILDTITKIGFKAFYNCSSLTSVVIPDSVTEIDTEAFYNCSSLTSVVIPDSVTEIGTEAFYNCSSLTSVVIGDNVNTIGNEAFANCSSLTSMEVPGCVTSIGSGAFSGCSNLQSITLPFVGGSKDATMASTSTLFGYIFGENSYIGGDETTQYYAYSYYATCTYYIPSGLTHVEITGGNILYGAFFNCTSLISVKMPDSALSIDNEAFRSCDSLISVVIPDSVTTIGEYAFNGCDSLTSVVIGDSVTTIGKDAFNGCYKLVEVINTSTHITVTKGKWDNGKVGFYALSVFNVGDTYVNKVTNDNGYIIYTDGAEKILVGYIGAETDLVLPDYITQINQSAFESCDSLTSVEIPNSVLNIDSHAFSFCDSLTSVEIPDSVTTIGESAFYYCTNLTSVVIGDSVTTIGKAAFNHCSSLTSVEVDANNTEYASKDGNLYNKDYTMLVQYAIGKKETSFTIPDSVTTIGERSFCYCTNLTSLVILDSVTTIGDDAFEYCSNLTSIEIPDSVTSIGSGAFSGCYNLQSITLPFVGGSKNATTVSSSTLFGYIFGINSYTGSTAVKQYYGSSSSDYRTYYIPSRLTQVAITGGNILYGAFYNCSNLTSVAIGDSVTTIGEKAFAHCDSLASVVIPDSVTTIGFAVFSGCSSLVEITLPFVGGSKNATTVSSSTLFGYIFGTNSYTGSTAAKQYYSSSSYTTYYIPSSLTQVTITGVEIPNSVTTIGNYAFNGCSSLTSVVIPDSITKIGFETFANCTSLTNVVIPDSVTEIDTEAFYNCSSLASVVIPDSVTTIGDDAFRKCSSLTSVVIPDSVTTIGKSAFFECTNLTSVVIGEGVTSIGSYAFYHCTALTEIKYNATSCKDLSPNNHEFSYAGQSGEGITVTIGANVKKIPANLFYHHYSSHSSKITSVVFEEGSVCESIGSHAFSDCTSLTSVIIPDSVTAIGVSAFSNCDSLTSVVIPDSVATIGGGAFSLCDSLTIVYYEGTSDEWEDISISNSSSALRNATKYYYIENEADVPTDDGKYWHYDENGNVAIW